ncbi:MAG: hypothetical protein RMJ59_04170 [Candidatus Nitrosocaldus sp.]|nr:hypothetical protein [Candidatus Nitrosocaldus sp.]MDW8275562.1 hypothetical protein [Candidatus Nitrosocaldus sp.]
MSEGEIDYKYMVQVKDGKSIRISDASKRELRDLGMMDDKGKLKIKGLSAKMLSRMKKEYVECPVLMRDVNFIECYVCSNFISRIKGQVYCKGEPLATA